LQVIGGLKRIQPGSWDGGWIYDPKVGKTYDVALSLKGERTLEVHGYLQTKLLGKKFLWNRARTRLQSCAEATSR
jgi:uncharacterized protein (DUF2147 family)